MNALEKYQEFLDNSNYDHSNSNQINTDYQKVIAELVEQKETDLIKLANLEREVFGLQKSFRIDQKTGIISGISWMFSGEKTLENGLIEPFYWPDVSKFTDDDFKYIGDRYKVIKNLYVKTEFGILLLFNSPFSEHKHNDFKKNLADLLFDLSKTYLDKYKADGKKSLDSYWFLNALQGSIYISIKNKYPDVTKKNIELLLAEFHKTDPSKKGSQNQLLELLQIIVDYFKEIKDLIDLKSIFQKCRDFAIETEKELLWSCMSIAEMCLRLQEKTKYSSDFNWLKYKAEIYEKLALDAEKTGNINAIPSFIDNALSIYQIIKDEENTKRLEKAYIEKRDEVVFTQFKQEVPKENVEKINKHITKTIETSDSDGIIEVLSTTPMFANLEKVRKSVTESKKSAVLLSMISLSIIDKYGNKIGQYDPEVGEYDSNFWQTYSFHFQLGNSILYEFFIQALKSGKLTYESFEKNLSQSWLYEPIIRKYNNKEYSVFPRDTILPPIRLAFDEFSKYIQDNSYNPNIIPIVDSLSIKIESLLRYFCQKIGIPTFKRTKVTDIIMEKNLDDLLSNLQHRPEGENINITNFIEEDRILIKYFLSEKAGQNLRNEVAHGLMEIYDYSPTQVAVLLSIILKISKYIFIPKDNDSK
jgi:hypothetical protein